ncbi:MAG TPA: F0F1 ATP synthase subunit epsilon [Bacteroidetes bacterium]|jgi:F-type H+-transporting ATPase subunit epsilon|nr:F0F1 ATP synthase subunit epsilon [Bacteroidota bacterium]
MYEKAFKLQIITPGRVVFQDEATSLSAPGTQGGFQILHSHAPFISTIEIGEMKVKDKNGRDLVYATSGGFVEVKANEVVVLAETAELGREIDLQRAKASNDRAAQRLRSHDSGIDLERARLSMMRSLNRLRVAAKA